MGIFKIAEKKLEGFVEGGFGRAFKAGVQPVELAHKLACLLYTSDAADE